MFTLLPYIFCFHSWYGLSAVGIGWHRRNNGVLSRFCGNILEHILKTCFCISVSRSPVLKHGPRSLTFWRVGKSAFETFLR